jgi:REP element-mobilizing transposase RayT
MEEDAMRKHDRRSIRWFAYDYAQAGAYFVTICTHDHVCLFGRVVGEAMELNPAGKAVWECWYAIPRHFPQVALDEFIVMPNHVHGIIVIGDDAGGDVGAHVGAKDGANDYSPLPGVRGTSRTVGSIVRGFKIGATKWMRRNTKVRAVWQRNYYEHVIRGERALGRIRRYIEDNPGNWMRDPDWRDGYCGGE